jgi:hypothetical protein
MRPISLEMPATRCSYAPPIPFQAPSTNRLDIALPWSNRWGLIVGVWLRYTTGVPYAVVMVWAANASAGHTKKTAVIALYHIGYGLGNIISPQLFQPRWKPRYKPTWIILLIVCALFTGVLCQLIISRSLLSCHLLS